MSENPVRSASEKAAFEWVVAAAEEAMKEKCCKIMCWMCARGTPTHVDEYGNTIHEESTGWERCKAEAIRAIPTGTALEEYIERAREEATLAEHKSHVEFENELYATLVDPVADGPIKEAELRKQLLESARWYRQHVYDLEGQLNAAVVEQRATAELRADFDRRGMVYDALHAEYERVNTEIANLKTQLAEAERNGRLDQRLT